MNYFQIVSAIPWQVMIAYMPYTGSNLARDDTGRLGDELVINEVI